MSSRCYGDYCLPDNQYNRSENQSESSGIGAGLGVFLVAVVFALIAVAVSMNVDPSSLDLSNLADNPYFFSF